MVSSIQLTTFTDGTSTDVVFIENLDRELLKFLKTNFKGAVKEKQRENEIQAGIDRWGAQYENSQKCIVM